MLHNVKKSFILTKIQMLFSENPDVYVKKQVQIRTQRPQITLKHICLFLSFFQSKNLLHSVIKSGNTYKQSMILQTSICILKKCKVERERSQKSWFRQNNGRFRNYRN